MPPNTTSTATIPIQVQNGQANTALQQTATILKQAVGGAASFLTQQMTNLTTAIGSGAAATAALGKVWGFAISQITTMGKALVSMMGVLVAYNLAVTLPQAIFKGIVTGIGFAIDAFNKMEQSIISIQALLAQNVKYSSDAATNFAMAGEEAVAVQKRLQTEARKTAATQEQLAQGYQAALGAGALQVVRNREELVQLTSLLVNAILPLTTGMNATQQIATEIRAVLGEGRISSSQLARALGISKKEMKEMLSSAEKTHDFLDKMKNKMTGFVQAQEKFAHSWEGVKSSIEDAARIFAQDFIRPVMYFVSVTLRKWLKAFDDAKDAIYELAGVIGGTLLLYAKEFGGYLEKTGKGIIPVISGLIRNMGVELYALALHGMNFARSIEPVVAIFRALLRYIEPTVAYLADLVQLSMAWASGDPMRIGFALVKSSGTMLRVNAQLTEATIAGIFDIAGAMAKIPKQLDVAAEKKRFSKEQDEESFRIYSELVNEAEKYNGLLERTFETKKKTAEIDEAALRAWAAKKKRAEEMLGRLTTTTKEEDPTVRLAFHIKELMRDAEEFRVDFPETWLKIWTEIQRIANEGLIEIRLDYEKQVDAAFLWLKKKLEEIALASQKAWEKSWRKTVEIHKKGVTDSIQATDRLLDRMHKTLQLLQLSAQGVFTRDVGVNLRDSMEAQLNEAEKKIREFPAKIAASREDEDWAQIFGNPEDVMFYEEATDKLKTQFETTKETVTATKGAMEELDFTIISSEVAMKRLVRVWAGLDKETKPAREMLMLMSIAMVDMISSFTSGSKTIGQALKSMAGQFLVLIGTILVMVGTAALMGQKISGIFGPMFGSTAGAMGAIVAGAAIMGVGQRLQGGGGGGGAGGEAPAAGGGGGATGAASTAPSYVTSRDIAVQQGIQSSMQANTHAVSGLNEEVSRLSKETGDVLVTKSIARNPKAVTNAVSSQAGKSYKTSKSMGGALLGEPA